MSRKMKLAAARIADLALASPVSTEELQQVQGGFQATLLRAMGWTAYTSDCLNGDGSSGTSTVWVKGDIIVAATGGKGA
ncbi:MAG: hypothetical protein IT424_01245 [Pirellulales bacterium]|nr:hypothetical protein [Pirellulales bacterium]